MNKESLFVLKPSEEIEQVAQEAINLAVGLDLVVNLMGRKVLTLEEATELYKPFENESWFPSFMLYLTSGEIQVYLTEGEDVIEKTLEVKMKVREKYARDGKRNAIHSPKTPEDLQHNIELFRRIL